jgi:cystathionine gamma-synthase/methionine-gamma-lyase
MSSEQTQLSQSDSQPNYALATRLVHAGEHDRHAPENAGKVIPTTVPIYATATFVHPRSADLDAAFARAEQGESEFIYTRYNNPTVEALEKAMASVEGGRGAVACASGMAALYLALLAAGTPRGATEPHPRHILASQDLYGSTHALMRRFFGAQNVGLSYFDVTDLKAFKALLDELEPDVVLVESLSNPLLKMADIETLAKLAHDADARLVVDATLTTPVAHLPLEQGADIVVHSATKYLSGHADVSGGVLTARTGFMLNMARAYCRQLGMQLGPFEARMISRGIKTLSLRMKQQCNNALRVAQRLEKHPQVSRVLYPGLASHPQHKFAALNYCGIFGAMVTFELRECGRQQVFQFMDDLRLVLPATSLGDIYTLITYPPVSSHRDVSADELRAQGITEGMVRLSVGIEDVEDIMADLEQALAKI